MAFVKLLNQRGINTEHISHWKDVGGHTRVRFYDGSELTYAPEDWEQIEKTLFPRARKKPEAK